METKNENEYSQYEHEINHNLLLKRYTASQNLQLQMYTANNNLKLQMHTIHQYLQLQIRGLSVKEGSQ
jgi:hypothetical protein